MKKFLGFILSILIVSTCAMVGCDETSSSDSDVTGDIPHAEESIKTIELDTDNLPILKGDSYQIALTTYADNEILSGVTYEYESKDTSVATVSGNVLNGVNFGETIIIVTIKLNGTVIATKELQCKVNNNNAIYTNKVVYELYTLDSVLKTSFKTEETISTSMYVDGEKITNYGNITWVSDDPSIATVDKKGNITALSAGETYVVGNYRYGNQNVSTRKIPVKVSKPYLSTDIDVLFDKNLGTGLFKGTKVLGEGYSVGKVVDIQTNKEYTTTDNMIDLNNLLVGEYRFAVYEADEKFATEVNVIVADYVIDDIDEFQNIEWYSYSYVVLNTDLTNVGQYRSTGGGIPDFTGTFNGMGHKITGINYRFNNQALFSTIRNATIKNLAVQCTISGEKKGQGALFYRSVDAVVENVYIETTFASSATRCGGLCDIILNSFTVKNSIVKTFDAFDSNVYGAMTARSQLMKVTYENAYFISPLKLCSETQNSNNTKKDFINNSTVGILFEAEEDFIKAAEKGNVSFDGFNHYWDLSGDVPIFKSLK